MTTKVTIEACLVETKVVFVQIKDGTDIKKVILSNGENCRTLSLIIKK